MKKIRATVTQLFLCPLNKGYDTHDVSSSAVKEIIFDHQGIVGDRHFGPVLLAGGRQKQYAAPGTLLPNLRQVSLIAQEELDEIAFRLGVQSITGADVGANIVLGGVPNLTFFPCGVNGIIKFPSGALLHCMGENEPCDGPGKTIATRLEQPELANKFQKVAMHRRGIVAMVARPGVVSGGDIAELLFPAWTKWSPNIHITKAHVFG